MNADRQARVAAALEAAISANALRPDADLWKVRPLPVAEVIGPTQLAKDAAAVFERAWLPVARESDLEAPGAWRRVDVGRRRWLVVRDGSGRIAVHANVCPHRGARLVDGDSGADAAFRCRYHGLVWELDGALRSDPKAFGFAPGECPRRLPAVRSDTWGGWVWFTADPDAPSLAAFLGEELVDLLAGWSLDRLAVAHRFEVDAPFSWRLGIDGFLEPLHVPLVHPKTIGPLIKGFQHGNMLAFGDHSVMFAGWRLQGVFGPDGPLGRIAREAGVDPLPELGAAEAGGNFVFHVFPNTIVNLLPHHVTIVQMWPRPEGGTRVRHEVLGMPAATPGQKGWLDALVPGYRQLVQEDLTALAAVQDGLASGALAEAPLTWYERRIRWFHDRLIAWHARGPDGGPA